MTEETPFYERTLDSFSDEIITRVRQSESNGLWYATMDIGSGTTVGYPDFSSCGRSREEAVVLCANWIRSAQALAGQTGIKQCLYPKGYDFHWRLCRWWAEKEMM